VNINHYEKYTESKEYKDNMKKYTEDWHPEYIKSTDEDWSPKKYMKSTEDWVNLPNARKIRALEALFPNGIKRTQYGELFKVIKFLSEFR
jgi:hypothetical protein